MRLPLPFRKLPRLPPEPVRTTISSYKLDDILRKAGSMSSLDEIAGYLEGHEITRRMILDNPNILRLSGFLSIERKTELEPQNGEWKCSYCGGKRPASEFRCGYCGGPK